MPIPNGRRAQTTDCRRVVHRTLVRSVRCPSTGRYIQLVRPDYDTDVTNHDTDPLEEPTERGDDLLVRFRHIRILDSA